MTKSQNVEDLMRPSDAAEKLGISVATLRKYSLIVEAATNEDYFVRTTQKTRLYSEQNVKDLQKFQELSKNSSLTLKESADQVYGNGHGSSKVVATKKISKAEPVQDVTALKKKIADQNKEIKALKAEIAELKQRNKTNVQDSQDSVITNNESVTTSNDEDFIDDLPDLEAVEQARAEMGISVSESSVEEVDPKEQILAKAQENFEEHGANEHRTLADMQVPDEKEHWWQRVFKK